MCSPMASRLSAVAAVSAGRGFSTTSWGGRPHLHVGGVFEHFNTPFHYARQRGLYERNAGFAIDWTVYPGGTGAMGAALERGDIEVAVMRSEGAVARIATGSRFRIAGTYLSSPLPWGVHVAQQSPFVAVEELKGQAFGVSRMGSGSHLMTLFMAQQLGWNIPGGDCPLEVVGSLDGAREALRHERISAFCSEKFTSKHFVDDNEWRCIGDVPGPWAGLVFVASDKALANRAEDIVAFINVTRLMCLEFKANEGDASAKYVSENHRMSVEDAREWLDGTDWSCAAEVAASTLRRTSEFLVHVRQIDALPAESELVAADCFVRTDV